MLDGDRCRRHSGSREAETPESRKLLREQTSQAVAKGIFGAPSFVAGNELFWGTDRLEAAIEWCQGGKEI
jgi:2-hydroxychromene-2-carboxylate isomerase